MTQKKRYKLCQSPLFRTGTKRDLAEKLNVSLRQLLWLRGESGHYKKDLVKTKRDGSESTRELQPSFGLRKKVHTRFKTLLNRIEIPNYLNSGIKGKSIIDNADIHKNNNFMLKIDIEKFYPSCKQKYVYRLFRYVFEMDKDVAYLASKVTTYEDFIPTGSPLSQIMAFYSNRGVFNQIQSLCISNGIDFSLYVDDLTFSSKKKISKKFIKQIIRILSKTELRVKACKEKSYGDKDFKLVTGVIISPKGELRVPNKLSFKIYKIIKKSRSLEKLEDFELRTLGGLLSQARMIDKTFMPTLNTNVHNRLRAI